MQYVLASVFPRFHYTFYKNIIKIVCIWCEENIFKTVYSFLSKTFHRIAIVRNLKIVMQEKVTLKKAIAIMKLSLFVIWFWPLPLGTSKYKILCVKLYQYICILMTIGVISSVIYGLVKNKNTNDLDGFMRSLFSLVTCSHVIGNILCHLIIYQRLQVFNTFCFWEIKFSSHVMNQNNIILMNCSTLLSKWRIFAHWSSLTRKRLFSGSMLISIPIFMVSA